MLAAGMWVLNGRQEVFWTISAELRAPDPCPVPALPMIDLVGEAYVIARIEEIEEGKVPYPPGSEVLLKCTSGMNDMARHGNPARVRIEHARHFSVLTGELLSEGYTVMHYH